MKACKMRFSLVAAVAIGVMAVAARAQTAAYFPPRGTWECRAPSAVGLDPAALQRAVDFSIAHENPGSRDMVTFLHDSFFPHDPNWKLHGPTRARADLTGVIVHRGYVVAAWGNPDRVDM